MKRFFKILLIGGMLFNLPLVSHATTGQEKSTMCSGCHGTSGISINPQWPNLAGQNESYFIKQMNDYKKNQSRRADIMSAMALNLTDADIRMLASYYATLKRPENTTPEQYKIKGEALYRHGDSEKHITACIVCHGPKGAGNAQAGFPALSGQQALYTLQQLEAFKDHTRKNDLNGIMQDISAHMTHEDMETVAYYLMGLH